MQRLTIRGASRLAVAGALFLTLVAPVAVLAADPVGAPNASAQASALPAEVTPSPSPSDPVIAVDPSFITSSSTPVGSVLSATGQPEHTLPATDAVAGTSRASTTPQGLPLLLLGLATICLVAARLPEVRGR